MGRKKKAPTFIKSVRVPEDMKEFFSVLQEKNINTNDFIISVLQQSEEWQEFILNKKEKENAESLLQFME